MLSCSFYFYHTMHADYTSNTTFKGENFGATPLPGKEYENCTFIECSFANADLSRLIFSECVFEHCDLSLAKLKGATIRDIKFKHCKMLGLRFDECNTFLVSFGFENCTLNFSSFYQLKIRQTIFKHCKLESVDFTQADLTKSLFDDCDLLNATFDGTTLSQADLRSAVNFSIDPEKNTVTKARFSSHNLSGLLHKYKLDIH